MMTGLNEAKAFWSKRIADAKARISGDELKERVSDYPAPLEFLARLQSKQDKDGFAVIGEIGKPDIAISLFDPTELARAYELGGAAGLAIISDCATSERDLWQLQLARGATRLPVLCGDLMLDPYQIYQARSWGADCICLNVDAVADPVAQLLEREARDLAMEIIVEISNQQGLARAVQLGARLLCINQVDLAVSERLTKDAPSRFFVVSRGANYNHMGCLRLAQSDIGAIVMNESRALPRDAAIAMERVIQGHLAG
ncbi:MULTISPECIES: indole-3-glycerol-phosphate synthase TrpC [unclassified Sinorhizobium]|uniref:indole-3-glycerol-phosphate synthase TrpC n=1 Tax=unclassified Sinorhizobium TaxID=2613772 RepID=UPI00352690F4